MKFAGGRFKIKKSGYLFLTSTSKIQNSEPQVVLQIPKCTEFKKKLGKNNGSKTYPLNADTKYENTTTDPENTWAIGHWKLLGQHWGIMIQVSSSLHFSLQQKQSREKLWTLVMKSQNTSLPVSSFVHTEASETTGAAVLASTHGQSWEALTDLGTSLRWWGCTVGCLAAWCSSHPASLCWQPRLQSTAPGPSSPRGKGSSDGCTGLSVTIPSRWSHREEPEFPEGLQCDPLLPCPSQC